MGSDDAWWVRRNACFALANMGPEGETALLDLLHSDDRYARDRAAATMEARGFTRRAIRNLSKPGRRGERARDTVSTLIKVGAIRYLKDLAETLPDGDNRNVLREMLEEHGVPSTDAAPPDAESPEAGSPAAASSDGESPDGASPNGASPDVESPDGASSGRESSDGASDGTEVNSGDATRREG